MNKKGKRMVKSIRLFVLLLCVSICIFPIRINASVTKLRNPCDGYWDCIYFGKYYQDSSTKKQDIRWRVLFCSNNDAFLISDKVLDCQPFNTLSEEEKWEDSSIREWLNSDFMNTAFSKKEQDAIKTTEVTNKDNWADSNDTQDKIYLLSYDELNSKEYSFWETDAVELSAERNATRRRAKCTKYAKERGVYTTGDYSPWWLRTSYSDNGEVTARHLREKGYSWGEKIDDNQIGVRPVMHIDLSKANWKYAGSFSGGKYSIGSAVKDVKASFKIKNNLKAYVVGQKRIYYQCSISIKKQEGIDGYQVWYSTKRKMTEKNKKYTHSYGSFAILTGLKRGKTYYVKIRPYTNYMPHGVAGKWSKIQKLKI